MSNAINSTKLEALVAENKRCFSKDLASAAEQLYTLENRIQGRPGRLHSGLGSPMNSTKILSSGMTKWQMRYVRPFRTQIKRMAGQLPSISITRKPLSFHRNSGALPITCPVVEMRKHWQTWPPLAFLEQTPPMMNSAVLLRI